MRIDGQSPVSSASSGTSFESAIGAKKSESSDGGEATAVSTDAGGKTSVSGTSSGLAGNGLVQATAALQESLTELKEMIADLAAMISEMSSDSKASGAPVPNRGGSISSAPSEGSNIRSAGGSGNLGGTQRASDKLPDPVTDIQTVQLGSKSVTVGGDGSATRSEVNSAASELRNLYTNSSSFQKTVDNSGSENMTLAVGRRDDNTSWGGGGRVFMNVNNVAPGSNNTFQALVAHEFGHAAAGMSHGSALDNLSSAVAAEA